MGRLCIFFSAAIITISLVFYAFTNHAMVIRERKETPLRGYPRMVQQKNEIHDQQNGLGAKEIQRPDGGTDRIYYSIITPEEEEIRDREEKEKQDRSWDMMKGILIDKRTR
jgi:hypothetical protein